jgi:hypothetical protein
MKRTLIAAAAGAIGAAGAISAASLITAAPAMADVGCTPDFVCDVLDQPGVFLNDLASQPGEFLTSIDPATQTNRFVMGSCSGSGYTGGPVTDNEAECGILDQPGYFLSDLASQPGTFVADLASQPGTFLANPDGTGITQQGQTFVDSITKPFGPDTGPDHDD